MTDLTAYLAAAVFIVFAAYRKAAAGGDATQRSIYAFALCMGTALVLNAPFSVSHLGLLPHERALLVALVHALKMAAFTCLALIALSLRRRTDDRGPVYGHIGAGIAAQALSAVLFATSQVAVTPDAVTVGDGRRLVFAGYELLFAVYGIWCLVMLVRALTGHVCNETNGVVRVGLGLMALSAGVGVLWTAWSAHDMTMTLLHGRQGLGEDLPSTLFSTAVAVLAVAGASATRWPVLFGGPLRWVRARRSYRALEPLWSALHSELPEIALAPPDAGRAARPREATYALYRRVIEIRDAHLALRPYFDGLPPAAAEAGDPALEAAAIATALANRRAGRRPGEGGNGAADGGGPAGAWPVPGTLDAETDWLLQVTRAFVRRAAAPEPLPPRAGRRSESAHLTRLTRDCPHSDRIESKSSRTAK